IAMQTVVASSFSTFLRFSISKASRSPPLSGFVSTRISRPTVTIFPPETRGIFRHYKHWQTLATLLKEGRSIVVAGQPGITVAVWAGDGQHGRDHFTGDQS